MHVITPFFCAIYFLKNRNKSGIIMKKTVRDKKYIM